MLAGGARRTVIGGGRRAAVVLGATQEEAWLRWREVLGGVGTGAAAVSLRWRVVAGGAEELWRRWLGLGHGSVRG